MSETAAVIIVIFSLTKSWVRGGVGQSGEEAVQITPHPATVTCWQTPAVLLPLLGRQQLLYTCHSSTFPSPLPIVYRVLSFYSLDTS